MMLNLIHSRILFNALLRPLILFPLLAACAPQGIELVEAEPITTVLPPPAPSLSATRLPTPTVTLPIAAPSAAPAILPTSSPTPEIDWSDVNPAGQTVFFWHTLSYDREEALQALVKDFNRSNQWGITVKAQYQGDFGDLFEKTAQVLNTPESPQLILAYQDQAIELWLAQGLVNLDSLVRDPAWGFTPAEQQDFFPNIWSQDTIPIFGNARLGFPAYRAMDVLYYNADWLAELNQAGLIDFTGPPQNPQQFRAAACAAVDQAFSKAKSGPALGYELNTGASRLASWSYAFGGDLFDVPESHFTFDHPQVVEAMVFMQGLFLSGCAGLARESYSDQDDFGAGTVLFTTGTSTGLPFYEEAVNQGARFRWNVAAIPHVTEYPRQNAYGPSLSLLRTTPEGELAAWLFMKYFSAGETQARWAQASGYFPVRMSAQEKLSDTLASHPLQAAILGFLPYGASEPNVPGYQQARVLVSEALAAIASGADVAETLQELNGQANAILEGQLTGP